MSNSTVTVVFTLDLYIAMGSLKILQLSDKNKTGNECIT